MEFTPEQIEVARKLKEAFAASLIVDGLCPPDQIPGWENDQEFCAKSLFIEDNRGRTIPFEWNAQQVRLHEQIEKQRAAKKPVRLWILKYRRGGLSTGIAGKMFKNTAFVDGQRTLILAHEKKAARNLFSIYDRFQERYKPYKGVELPKLSARSAGEESGSLRWANGSAVEIATAKNVEFGRSFNYRRCHLSEFAFYPSIKKLMAGLAATVPDDPDTWIIKETTANGRNEAWKEWVALLEGKSEWEAMFLGCFEDPTNVRPLDVDPHAFAQSMTDEEHALLMRHRLSYEQLNWRRYKIENDYQGDETVFNQEYPHSWEVAFASMGRNRFSPKLFIHMPAMDGERGELQHWDAGRQGTRLTFVLNPRGSMEVWKRPEEYKEYIIGADSAEGVDINEGVGTPDPDYACAEVYERSMRQQVAELRERLESTEFAEYLFDLGKWYNWAYIVPESWPGEGAATTKHLIERGYPLDRIYMGKVLDERTQRFTEKVGWRNTPISKTQLLSNFEKILMSREIIIRSKLSLAEFDTFVRKPSKLAGYSKVGAASGSHDDTRIANMLAALGLAEAPAMKKPVTDKPVQWGVSKYGPARQSDREREIAARLARM